MFKFKEFTIKQDRTAMKVGTDGVLLGAWVNIDSTDRQFLDIGSGTGLIALMLAQRSENAHIDAVEIDSESADQAMENIAESKWSQVVDLHNIDIANFDNNLRYNLIVSNPPFFSDSLLPPDKSRTTARHTVSLTFDSLISSVERLLEPGGRFALILPTQEAKRFQANAAGRLHLCRRCLIRSRQGGDYKRVMCEYRHEEPTEILQEELSIRERDSNEYSAEYKALTANFYLKF